MSRKRSLTLLTTLVLGLTLIIATASCSGGDNDVPQDDTLTVADTTAAATADPVKADTTLGELLAQAPEPDHDPRASDRPESDESVSSNAETPAAEDEAADAEPADGPSLSARYRLASVDGYALPVALVEGPDCVVELIRGTVRIREDRTFELGTSTHENCAGEIRNDQLHDASGTVVLDGRRLRFDATDGEAFAVAHGRYLSDGNIVIERLEFEGGEHEVRWEFVR